MLACSLTSSLDCVVGETGINTKPVTWTTPLCKSFGFRVFPFWLRWGGGATRAPRPIAGSRCGCSQLRVVDLSRSDGRLHPPSRLAFSVGALSWEQPRQPLGHCCIAEACPG